MSSNTSQADQADFEKIKMELAEATVKNLHLQEHNEKLLAKDRSVEALITKLSKNLEAEKTKVLRSQQQTALLHVHQAEEERLKIALGDASSQVRQLQQKNEELVFH